MVRRLLHFQSFLIDLFLLSCVNDDRTWVEKNSLWQLVRDKFLNCETKYFVVKTSLWIKSCFHFLFMMYFFKFQMVVNRGWPREKCHPVLWTPLITCTQHVVKYFRTVPLWAGRVITAQWGETWNKPTCVVSNNPYSYLVFRLVVYYKWRGYNYLLTLNKKRATPICSSLGGTGIPLICSSLDGTSIPFAHCQGLSVSIT